MGWGREGGYGGVAAGVLAPVMAPAHSPVPSWPLPAQVITSSSLLNTWPFNWAKHTTLKDGSQSS